MKTLFVSRHPGALEWAKGKGVNCATLVEHLDVTVIEKGDLVIGTLPVHLAADVCERGGRYMHLSMSIPMSERGKELSEADMTAFGARLEEFNVKRVNLPST